MSRNPAACSLLILLAASGALSLFARPVHADTVLYRYEGDILLSDPATGWLLLNPCESGCVEGLNGGVFTLFWAEPSADHAEYAFFIAQDPAPPPPTLWMEWRFRSNYPFGFVFEGCDAHFDVRYKGNSGFVYMYGDAAITDGGGTVVTGLDINEFHTYRYESADGVNYRISVDGSVFVTRTEDMPSDASFFRLSGSGGCIDDAIPNKLNEWDFVRYGTLGDGEDISATDPPAGFVDPEAVANFDRFTVMFDQPAYVYLDDITVSGSETVPPQVIATRRLDNSEPELLEFLLDRALIPDETVTFTFDDGATVNAVTYTYSVDPYVPAVSEWGLTVTALLLLVAGSVLLRTRIARDT